MYLINRMRHFLIVWVLWSIFLTSSIRSQSCSNIVENADFVSNLDDWTQFGSTGSIVIENESGNNYLRIQNVDGSNIGVVQSVTFDPPVNKVLHFSYRVKSLALGTDALVSLDICLKMIVDNETSTYCYIQELRVHDSDFNQWVFKEAFYSPAGNITSMTIYLLAYTDTSNTQFDDVMVCFEDTSIFTFQNSYTTMKINNFGFVGSITNENGDEFIEKSETLARLYFRDGRNVGTKKLIHAEATPTDKFEVSFLGSDVTFLMEIKSSTDAAFLFRLIDVRNPSAEDIHYVQYCKVTLVSVKENVEWSKTAEDDIDMFFAFLPLDDRSVCRYAGGTSYSCSIDETLDWQDTSTCLVTAPKGEQWASAQEKVVIEYDLPHMVLDNGDWLRKKTLREGYLFATVTEENHLDLLQYADWAKFPVILAINPIRYGLYNRPMKFGQNITRFYEVMDLFMARGIKIGIHTFLCRVLYDDPLFSVPNLFKGTVSNLATGISETDQTITLTTNVEDEEFFQVYSPYNYFNVLKNYFAIDDEIIYCDVQGTTLINCERGKELTPATAHSVSSVVSFVPRASASFHLDPFNTAVFQQSVDSFAEVMNRLKVNFLYADGYALFPCLHFGAAWGHKHGAFPYFQAMENLQYAQYGETLSSFDYYYDPRGASWDGVIMDTKSFVKYHKMPLIEDYSPQAAKYFEYGWHKIGRSRYETGEFDYDATTFDDVHYAMGKVFVTERSMGLQLTENIAGNHRLENILKLFGRYHEMIARDVENEVIEREFKDEFSAVEKEFEINEDLNFVEKQTHKEYAVCESGTHEYSLLNEFEDQKLVVEIRPRFDYYPFADSRHEVISDFSTSGSLEKSVSNSDFVTCSVTNGGIVSVSSTRPNNAYVEGCKIRIRGTFDFTGKRGMGLDITGDDSNALISVQVSKVGAYGNRNWLRPVDFNGRQQLILGKPATEYDEFKDYPRQRFIFDPHKGSSWTVNYKDFDLVELIVYVRGGNSTNLQFHSLKAMKEKDQNLVVNPSITIGGKTLMFPVELTLNNKSSASIIEYDGNSREFCVYTYNFDLLACQTFKRDGIVVRQGANNVEITSDSSNSEYSQRCELKITTYGKIHQAIFNRNESGWVVALVVSILVISFACLVFVVVIVVIVVAVCWFSKKDQDSKYEVDKEMDPDTDK